MDTLGQVIDNTWCGRGSTVEVDVWKYYPIRRSDTDGRDAAFQVGLAGRGKHTEGAEEGYKFQTTTTILEFGLTCYLYGVRTLIS